MTEASPSPVRKHPRWYSPTLSPQHGVYVMLLVSFVTGAAAAQQWTWTTTLALICAFCGFQAEHPAILQIKQRRSWKPRFVVWTALYGGIASTIAFWLFVRAQGGGSLLAIYGAAGLAAIVDGVLVWWFRQTSIWNELIAFSAVCLSAPLAYVVTTGSISGMAIALWLLNAVFFSSAIFSVKLRKRREASGMAGLLFHGGAAGLVFALYQTHWLSVVAACSFAIAMCKFGFVFWQRDWYCNTKIQNVAMIETWSSVVFLMVVALSLLPARLT